MTAPGAGTPAATTPGRAACEKFWTVIRGRDGLRNDPVDAWPWAEFQNAQEAWEAAAQAAIEAAHARTPEQVGAIAGTLAGQLARELRDCEAGRQKRDLEIARLTVERDSLTGRVAELVTEGNELRRQAAALREALAEAVRHVEPVDQNSELAIAEWQALAAGRETVQSGQFHIGSPDGGGGRDAAQLREELAAVTANRDAWCERAGELLTETRKG